MLPQIKTILYATDLGENTRPVFRLAVSQARRYNARLLMLHVVEPLGSTGTAIIANYLSGEAADKINKDGARDILEVMKKRLDTFCKEELTAFGLDRNPVTEIMVATGKPCEEILKVAKKYQADMIVMGNSAHSVLLRKVLGDTLLATLRDTEIPLFLAQ